MIISKILDKVFKIINAINRILMLIIFITMWIVVFGRYLFNSTPIWGDELILLSISWLAMLSGAEALRKDIHMKITIIDNFISDNFIKYQRLIYDLIILIASTILFKYGLDAAIAKLNVYNQGLKIPEAVKYAAIPTGFMLIIIIICERFINLLLANDKGIYFKKDDNLNEMKKEIEAGKEKNRHQNEDYESEQRRELQNGY